MTIKNRNKFKAFLTIVLILFFSNSVFGAASKEAPVKKSVVVKDVQTKKKSPFIKLQKRLVKDGFNSEKVKKIFDNEKVCFESSGVALFFMHNEGKLNYNQFATKKSISKAKKYMTEHKKELKRIEKKYGVDATVIIAITLVETRLGKYTGKMSILNTLSTMAAALDKSVKAKLWKEISSKKKISKKKFNSKVKSKSRWAYLELKAFLKYAAKEGINPSSINGSYAGAVGIPQFMPSNILRLGKDGNKDGRIDLFNHVDSHESIANYLKHFGWKPEIKKKKAYEVLYRYNHSKPYVSILLKIADKLKKG